MRSILLALLLIPLLAIAGGNSNSNGPQGGNATAAAASSATVGDISAIGGGGSASAAATAGGQSASMSMRAYGAGSTGLAATAACLGSFGAAFNLVSATYVEPGCVHRYYTFVICTRAKDENECFFQMACMDPDASAQFKEYIGCSKRQPVAETSNPDKTAFTSTQ